MVLLIAVGFLSICFLFDAVVNLGFPKELSDFVTENYYLEYGLSPRMKKIYGYLEFIGAIFIWAIQHSILSHVGLLCLIIPGALQFVQHIKHSNWTEALVYGSLTLLATFLFFAETFLLLSGGTYRYG